MNLNPIYVFCLFVSLLASVVNNLVSIQWIMLLVLLFPWATLFSSIRNMCLVALCILRPLFLLSLLQPQGYSKPAYKRWFHHMLDKQKLVRTISLDMQIGIPNSTYDLLFFFTDTILLF